MNEGVLTEALPEGGAVDAPSEQREEAAAHTPEESTPGASEAAAQTPEESAPGASESPAPCPPAGPQESETVAPGAEDPPVQPETPLLEHSERGPQEPPEDWLEPLEEDDFEDEEDETRSWGQSESREGSVSGSTAGRGRGGRRRRPRLLIEEEWDECPCLGEGWKRKEVFRRSGCYMGKSDTYYMSPTGVRVRSKVELAKCLSSSVDLDMFDFKSGQFLSGQLPRKRRRWAKESKQSDQSQEEEEEEEQLLAKKERLPAKRKRAKNFSDVEKKHLHQLVLNFPAAQSKRRGYRSSSETDKSKAWAEICQHFNQATDTPRTLKQLQFLWQKMRLEGGLKAVQRQRGPRVRGSTLAQLRRREGKRRRRRVQASSTVATATSPASDSPPHQQPQQQQHLPSVSPSSPLQAQPAPPSPGEAPAPAPTTTPVPTPLPFQLHVKQESSDTLISNTYTLTHAHTLTDTLTDTLTHAHTLTDTLTHAHTLTDTLTNTHTLTDTLTHAHTHPSTRGQAYQPTSAEVAPCSSPQRPPSNTSTGGRQIDEAQPSAPTESSVSGSSSWTPPCGVSVVARREERRSLSERLDLRFHRRRMRFLQQEHELRMRVLQLELSLRQQERDLLLSRTASATNHTPAHPHTANDAAAQPHGANDSTVHCQTANDKAAHRQTTNHSTVFSEAVSEVTARKKRGNHSKVRRLTADQAPDPAHSTSPKPRSPVQQLAKQKQTANALLALIAGGRKSQLRRSLQPDSQSESRQDPPSRPPYPTKLHRHSNRQPGRKGVGSKSHTPSASKRRGRVTSV